MESSNQLANRFREVLLNGKWVARTNYRELLTDLSWQEATTQVSNFNTIAALTYHVNYYIAGVLNVFEGGNLEIRDKFSFELKNLDTAEDWQVLLLQVWSNAERFANHIEKMDEEKLESGFVKTEYGSYRRNIEGMIEHCYYHLGQISMLKKAIKG